MKAISDPRLRQQSIFGERYHAQHTVLTNHTQSLKHIGDFWEESSVKLFHGKQLSIRSGRSCPDLLIGDHLCECKSVGRSSRLMIYKNQIDRYIELEVIYLVWVHGIHIRKPFIEMTLDELRYRLSQSLKKIIIIDSKQIYHLAQPRFKRTEYYLSNNRGKAIADIANIPLSLLVDGCQTACSFDFDVYGHRVCSIPIFNYTNHHFGP